MHPEWIWRDNLVPVLDLLASLAGHRFDDDDLNAVELGIRDTDCDADRWFEYEFSGKITVKVYIAEDRGANVRMLKVESPPDVGLSVATVIDVAQRYKLSAN